MLSHLNWYTLSFKKPVNPCDGHFRPKHCLYQNYSKIKKSDTLVLVKRKETTCHGTNKKGTISPIRKLLILVFESSWPTHATIDMLITGCNFYFSTDLPQPLETLIDIIVQEAFLKMIYWILGRLTTKIQKSQFFSIFTQ